MRGSLTLKLLRSMLFVLVVTGIFALAYDNIVSNDRLDKAAIARDLGLIISAVYVAPGDLTYVYDFGRYEYRVIIREGEVRILDPDANPDRIIGTEVYYYAIKGDDIDFDSGGIVDQLLIHKDDSGVSVRALPKEGAARSSVAFGAFMRELVEEREECKVDYAFGSFFSQDDVIRFTSSTVIHDHKGTLDTMRMENVVVVDYDDLEEALEDPESKQRPRVIAPAGGEHETNVMHASQVAIIYTGEYIVITPSDPRIEVSSC